MRLMGKLNSQRKVHSFFGQGIQQARQMKREMLYPCYTMRCADLPVAHAN
ncbi:DUF4113 domain-containing protein [Cronobacter turicensis]|nr:DUF4113 domain-containing protein [Cronobacter turicensis]MDI7404413.1 DUF4113 domain-containing protein [Cronobacter turicensis]